MEYTVCCIKECERKSLALGLCSLHWRRNRLYGSPVATMWHSGTAQHTTVEERFMQRVRKLENGCWTWLGSKDVDGYPMFSATINGVQLRKGHRVSYAMFKGAIEDGLHVCHTCDNPSCVNPDHLFLGTNAINMRDKITKGRARVPIGEKSPHAMMTEKQAQTALLDPRPYSAIAADLGVSVGAISSLKQRQSWRHLEGDAAKGVRAGMRGESHYSTRLSADDVRYIRSSKETGKDLAVKYGVSRQTITDIRKLRSWKHIS